MAKGNSHIFSVLRGSVGGITYLSGRNNAIVARQRTSPIQPNSQFQSLSKVAFASAVAAWEDATDQQREDWAAYAQTVTFTGPLGPYQPSGRDLAIAQFQMAAFGVSTGGVIIIGDPDMVPPVAAGRLALDAVVIGGLAAPGTGISLSFDNNNGESVIAITRRSLQQSSARNFFKGPFIANSIFGTTVADGNSGTAEYTGLVEDGVYFIHVRLLSSASPRRYSNDFIFRAVAETNP